MESFAVVFFIIIIQFNIVLRTNQNPYNYSTHSYNQNQQQHDNTHIKLDGETSKYIDFQIKHQNGSVNVRVHLSLQLKNEEITTTTTTPKLSSNDKMYNDGGYEYFTIDEAIEAFRKDLIEKETNIGGIIESPGVFYRHFNLKYEHLEIRLRCRYYSNYAYRKLNIYCFEYSDEKGDDILLYESDYQEKSSRTVSRSINTRTINVKDYSQTLHMSIQ